MNSLLESVPMSLAYETVVVGLVALAVLLLVVGIGSVVQGQDSVSRRFMLARRNVARQDVSLRSDHEAPSFLKFFEPLEGKIVPTKPEDLTALRRRLFRAGYRHPRAPFIYYAVRLLITLAMLPLSIVGLQLTGAQLPTANLVTASVVLSGIGFYLPVFWVSHRISVRQQRTRAGLPDAIDMLLVCIEAGLSLGAALERVAKEIGAAHPVIGQELVEVSLAMQAGKRREDALRDFADRMAIDEVRSLVAMIIQTEALGTSIAQGLRVHAEDIRRKRFLRAEEMANKLPVKMTIPLGLFIMPTLMIVVLTPVIIRIIRVLMPVMQ